LKISLKHRYSPQQIRQLILSKAEGNPFYIEEVTKALLESGVLNKINGSYQLIKPVEEIQVPETIQDVILSRIDRLARQAREALQLASVIGREFTVRLLKRITDIESRLDDMLEELKLLELIYQKEYFPELSYMFKHALTHDVAYYTLLTERRNKLHRIIGAAIEELYSDRLPDHYEMLAHHYLEGENLEKALIYLVKAGQKAEAGFANKDALSYYAKALDVCSKTGKPGIEKSVDVLQMKGMLNFTVGNYAEAIIDYKKMGLMAHQLRNVHQQGLALAGQAWAEWWDHDFDTAENTAKSALSIAGENFDDVEFFACSTLGLMYYGIHRCEEAEPYLRKAEELAPRIDNNFIRSWFSIVGWHQSQWEAKYEETLQHLSRWRNSLEKTNNIFLILGDRWLQAVTLASKGDYNRAMELLNEVINTSNRIGGIPFWHSRSLNTIGYVYGELQDFSKAIEWNSMGVEAAIKAQFDDPEVESNARLNLGDNYMAIGDFDGAEEQYKIVERVVRIPKPPERLDLWRYAQHLFHSVGELCLKRDEYDKALSYANECLSLAESGKSRKYMAMGWRLRGKVYWKQGKMKQAEKELSIALEMAQEVGNPPQLWKTFLSYGNLKQSLEKIKEAQIAYRHALQVIDEVAEKIEDRQLKETFLHSDHVREIRHLADQPSGLYTI
jgi:tetratricopeptide (TPR) repeat protein